jgi:hypothetical protein
LIPPVADHLKKARGPQPRVLFEGLLNEVQKRVGRKRPGRARPESLGFQSAFDSIGVEVEFGSDGPDLPMLDIEKAANRGNQFLRDHPSPRFVKRVEKAAQSAAEMTDQPSEIGEGLQNASPDWPERLRIVGGRDSGGIQRGFGSMIRHANCGRELRGSDLAAAISSLAVAMVEASFRTLLMPATSRAQLRDAGSKATVRAAIALPPVAVGADQEEDATMFSLTESLTERPIRRRREQHHRA